MKRTARLVRRALEGRPAAPDPWIRGAADVAAAVARSGTTSRREGAPAAGGPGSVISTRGPSHTAGGLGGGSGRQLAHAAGGPGAVSSRDIAHAAAGPGAISGVITSPLHALGAVRGSEGKNGKGGQGAVEVHGEFHGEHHSLQGSQGGRNAEEYLQGAAKGGQGERVGPKATISGVITSPLHALGAVRGSEGKNGKGGQGPVEVHGEFHGEHHSLQGGQGGRNAEEYLQGAAKGSQGDRVGPKATAGPGRVLALAASLDTEGADHHLTADSSGSASASKVCHISVHDKPFVSSMSKDREFHVAIAGDDEEWSTAIDVSDQISSRLSQSTEPIVTFRIDSSRWPNSTCLETWLNLLSIKSVQELDVLNLGHSASTAFPIDCLQSKKLKSLRIGFFAVPLDLLCFNYTSLQTLEFFACSLEGNKLSWVITDCPALQVLKVYYCSVDLHIKSNSLQVLDCHGNIGSRIAIASSPKLSSVTCGITANQKSAIVRQKVSASIYLSDVPSLEALNDVSLPYNKILVDTKDLAKVSVPLPVLMLSVSLEMSNVMQLQHLCKLLESFPMLQSLSIRRMDNVAPDEGFNIRIDEPFEDLCVIDCVKNCLTSFSLQNFRGGQSENHLIKCLMKNAPNLTHLCTIRHESTTKKTMRQAVEEIKSCDRASKDCKFFFE